MTEPKALSVVRTAKDITDDYQRLAFKAGDLGYKVVSFQKDLAQVHEQMRDLNFEYVALQNAEKQAAAEQPSLAPAAPATQKEEG